MVSATTPLRLDAMRELKAAVRPSRLHLSLRWVVMPANRMNRDEFYTATAP